MVSPCPVGLWDLSEVPPLSQIPRHTPGGLPALHWFLSHAAVNAVPVGASQCPCCPQGWLTGPCCPRRCRTPEGTARRSAAAAAVTTSATGAASTSGGGRGPGPAAVSGTGGTGGRTATTSDPGGEWGSHLPCCTEPQRCRVGRALWGRLVRVAQGHVQVGLGCLQRGRPHARPGQLFQCSATFHGKNFFLVLR